jgi:hypothetical protein
MKRTAVMMAMAMLASSGLARAQESVAAGPASPIEGGKVMPGKAVAVTDIKEGQRVQVNYHTVNGKMHATQVRVMQARVE